MSPKRTLSGTARCRLAAMVGRLARWSALVLVVMTVNAILPSETSSSTPVTVTVRATLPFRTFFGYPLFTQNGAWTLSSTQSFSILQHR